MLNRITHSPHFSIIALIAILIIICVGCGKHEDAHTNIDVEILRFEQDITTVQPSDSVAFKDKYAEVLNIVYTRFSILPFDSMVSGILSMPIYEVFKNKVDSAFNSNDFMANGISTVLGNSFKRNSNYKLPNVITLISPYNQSVMITDNSIMLALNHYLGADEPMYEYFPEYLRKYKEPSRIKFDVAEALVRDSIEAVFFNNNESGTLVDYMLLEGVVAKAVMQLTETNDILGEYLAYNDDEINWIKNNSSKAWNRLIETDNLYSTSSKVISEMTLPSPAAYCIDGAAPAMIGRYFGYRMLENYLENENLQFSFNILPQLFSTSPQNILLKSKFNGK